MAVNIQSPQQPLSHQKDDDKKLVLIVGPGRSGTNHLVRLLRRIPNLSSRGEPFNPNTAWGLIERDVEQLGHWAGISFANRSDPQLKMLLKRHAMACLKIMLDTLPLHQSVLSVKILSDQVSARQVESIATSGFLASSVFVRRRVIDSFVSLTKAKMLSKWMHRDTTHAVPELKMDALRDYIQRHQQWHTEISAVFRRHEIPVGVMDYDTDIDCDEDDCVRKFILAAGDLMFEPASTTSLGGLVKQDRNKRIEDKVANWPEFSVELRKCGLFDKAMSPLEI